MRASFDATELAMIRKGQLFLLVCAALAFVIVILKVNLPQDESVPQFEVRQRVSNSHGMAIVIHSIMTAFATLLLSRGFWRLAVAVFVLGVLVSAAWIVAGFVLGENWWVYWR